MGYAAPPFGVVLSQDAAGGCRSALVVARFPGCFISLPLAKNHRRVSAGFAFFFFFFWGRGRGGTTTPPMGSLIIDHDYFFKKH